MSSHVSRFLNAFFLAGMLSSIFLMTIVSAESEVASDFLDVSSSHPNATAISYLAESGIVGGYADGNYLPDAQINRAEFTKIIVEAALGEVDTSDLSLTGIDQFTDLQEGQWYNPYVRAAVEAGMISGYSDGTYRAGDNVNFVEASKILVEGFDFFVSEADSNEEWYSLYVEKLENEQAIPFDIFSLGEEITRAQMSEMVYRLHAEIDGLPSLSLELLAGEAQYWEYDTLTYEALKGVRPVTLFFHADWCPTCVALESYLVVNIDSFPDGGIILQADYDTEKDLRQAYSINSQFTFVVLDAAGEIVDTLTTNNPASIRSAMEEAHGL
jgi:thiol-disulfide isomerase/thioredoxin